MAKAKAAATSTAIAPRKSTAVSTHVDFGNDAGAGFEGAGREAYAIPFLAVLQSGSPQCKKSEGAYIKGAEEGMIFNTVSNEVFDGDEGVVIIPAAFTQTFVEWGLREKGGGFIAEYDNVAGSALRANARRDEKNRDILPNGHALNDHRNHYVLYQDAEGLWQPVLMSLTSTGIKASRNWMSAMQRLCAANKAPMFGLMFRMTTQAQSNDKGSWYAPSFEYVSMVDDESAYEAAKAFYMQVKSGAVKNSPRDPSPDSTSASSGGDDDPNEM